MRCDRGRNGLQERDAPVCEDVAAISLDGPVWVNTHPQIQKRLVASQFRFAMRGITVPIPTVAKSSGTIRAVQYDPRIVRIFYPSQKHFNTIESFVQALCDRTAIANAGLAVASVGITVNRITGIEMFEASKPRAVRMASMRATKSGSFAYLENERSSESQPSGSMHDGQSQGLLGSGAT